MCARKSVCFKVCAHTDTHTVYLSPARLALSTPALPLLQQLAHIGSPLGNDGEERRRGWNERGGGGEE